MNSNLHICSSAKDFQIAKALTKDYTNWLGMDLCFQNIDREFETFDKMYGEPEGCFIFLTINDEVAGGVGVRRFKNDICEMKRLYIYDTFQGRGLGKLLCLEIIKQAKMLGYKKMILDTVSKLEQANRLYEKIGFKDIPAYYDNPDKTVRFMELELR